MKRILVVDDEENIRELYRDELVEEGYEVELAPDGHEALRKFESFRPDLVTLDVKMPGLRCCGGSGRRTRRFRSCC